MVFWFSPFYVFTIVSLFCPGFSTLGTVGTVSKISDCQPEGPGFNPRPRRGLNFRRPSFATPSVDREVKPLVKSLDVLSGDLKEPTHLSIRVG